MLVSCYAGYEVGSIGAIFGPRGWDSGREIGIRGNLSDLEEGVCYAITAKYDGVEEACRNQITDTDCAVGRGKTVEVFTFRKAGKVNELSASQYWALLREARETEYER